jgi:hypothetical protein
MVVLSPPLILSGWFVKAHPRFQSETQWFVVPYALFWVGGSFWLGLRMLSHIVDGHHSFPKAVKHTWYDLRLRFAFLPLIGSFFMTNEDRPQDDDKDA